MTERSFFFRENGNTMCMNVNPVHVLEDIIYARRSIRIFTNEEPEKDLVTLIINAGYAAPYAAQAVQGSTDFRRFVVIRRNSETMKTISILVKEAVIRMAEQLEQDEKLKETAGRFIKMLRILSEGDIPGFGSAPYLIIVAERKGSPPVEQQSIAHCLENMWLMATALGLGFHLVSILAQMGDSPEFCRLINIPPGEFSLNGCALGIPEEIPPKSPPKDAEKITIWLD